MNEFKTEPSSMSSLLMSPVRKFTDSNVAMGNYDHSADMAIRLMKERQTKIILVSRGGEAIGIVSKTDILYKVLSQGRNPSKVKLEEIMSSPILAVDPAATVQEALSMMDRHVVRQVIVSSGSSVLGIISRDDLFESVQLTTSSVEDSAIRGTPVCIINPQSIAFAKNMDTQNLVCPYCSSSFGSEDAMSSHISMTHRQAETPI
jgi:signal-transduction protein with cAMP-binding, CBS, and nucleotidyltransferase domain